MRAWTLPSVRVRAPRIALLFIVIAFLIALPSAADAQTVSPQSVEFDPSADHSRSVNGVAVVEGYELRFYVVGGTQALHVIEMGKPSPESDGKIRFNFVALLGAWPVNGTVYEARVVAVGPGGETPSTVSNQFVFPVTTPPPAPCDYDLSTTARSGTSSSTTGSVGVTAGTGCAWTASSDAAWLTITSGSNGSGNGAVGYSVAGNSTTSQRVGRLTIAGNTFTFTQSGGACSYSLSPGTRSIGTAATSGTVGVTAGSGCSWNASSSAGWLTITGGGSGSGNGTISYSVAANTASAGRAATVTVGTATFTLNQSGSCSYDLTPDTQTVANTASTGTATVTAANACAWTATSSAGWLSVTGGSTGSGNGAVSYSIAANNSTSARSATLTVGSAILSVTQNGACSYSVSPTSRTVTTAATAGSVNVTAGSSCAWTAASSSSWLTINSGTSGTGNGTISYDVAAYTGTAVRSATITVGTATFTVTQNGPCVYTITPKNQGFNPPSATGSVTVATSSSCSWTATRSGSWITITSGSSGTGNGTVRYRVSTNSGSSSRTGTLTVAGEPVIITQSAATAPSTPAGLRIINVR